ncbi:N-acetylneuraminate lyase [Paenibacillus albicereus]|uniref:N-acetylneuraminate lyase n=2 Tax=Paenibacillus albicereus TaxID=2726185 RepID=A0A6H2H462_9BACL|nr:N-acetylneuraminate lyase [Paenibacillus albicereus]
MEGAAAADRLSRFRGVTVAMYSAYGPDGEVSAEAARRLARHYAGTGVSGLYVGGSSGEGMLQTAEERKLVLEAVLEEVGGELAVTAHVGAASTRESVELARHAERAGADAVSAVPAIYYRLSEASVEAHWQAIVDSTELPFLIYHIPQTTGFQLGLPLLERMARQDKVIGVKISAESTFELQQFKAAGERAKQEAVAEAEAAGEGGDDEARGGRLLGAGRFLVLNGPDEQYLAGRSIGADGGIGGTYGVMPELFLALERCYAACRLAEARFWQAEINAIIAELLRFPSLYGGCKAMLRLRGIETGQPRRPLRPVESEADLARAASLNARIAELAARAASGAADGAREGRR